MTSPSLSENLTTVYQSHIKGFKSLISADRLSGGASQETYRIVFLDENDVEVTHAMRRTAGGEKAEILPGHPGPRAEANLMRAARSVGVPEPEVFYVLEDEDGLGDGFIMQWLEGEALGGRIVRGEQFAELRENLAYECGKVMARIHQIDVDKHNLRGQLEEISPVDFIEQTWQRYKDYNMPQPMIDYTARWLMENLPETTSFTLVHNDFRNGNFMVNSDEIVAVLDWELAHIGDPMRDLGWICVNSWRFGNAKPVGGFGEYEDLFRGYEEVSGKKVDADAVKFWQVFGSFWWAASSLGMAEHYRNGPDKTVERPGIGRRSSECQVDCANLLFPGKVDLVQAPTSEADLDMPRIDELIGSVRDFLREEVMVETKGRLSFMARVASNSLDIALREEQLGGAAKAAELKALQAYFKSDESLIALRWRVAKSLRDDSELLDDEGLQACLRSATANQLAIDQPKYSGLKVALGNG